MAAFSKPSQIVPWSTGGGAVIPKFRSTEILKVPQGFLGGTWKNMGKVDLWTLALRVMIKYMSNSQNGLFSFAAES